MIRSIALCLLVAVVTANPVKKFKDCGSVDGKITSLDITPCKAFPCQFPKGKNVTVIIGIKAGTSVTSAKTEVHGVIGGIPVPFPLSNVNACDSIGCPVQGGAEVTYKNAIFVKEAFPKIRLVVKWEIKDQNGKDLICFEVPVEIAD